MDCLFGTTKPDASPPPYDARIVAPPTALDHVTLTVNGRARSLPAAFAATTTLATYLREHELLTATKVSCREGGCGACTVLLKRPEDAHVVPVNACLRLVASCHGAQVTTAEGLGTAEAPHAFQRALAHADGTQCGFCSPGMVTAMVAAVEANGGCLTPEQAEAAFDGNICRCTGYRGILEAARSYACAHSCKKGLSDIEDLVHDVGAPLVPVSSTASPAVSYFRPETLADLAKVLSAHGGEGTVELVAANTARAGVVKYYSGEVRHWLPMAPVPDVLVDVTGVRELREISASSASDSVVVGAAVSLARVMHLADGLAAGARADSGNLWAAVSAHLGRVATPQVRAVGTVGGNLALASHYSAFPSDLSLLLAGADAEVDTFDVATGARKTLSVNELLASGRGVGPHRVIVRVRVPPPVSARRFFTAKLALRTHNAHALAHMVAALEVDGDMVVRRAALHYGAVRPGAVVRAPAAERALQGVHINDVGAFGPSLVAVEALAAEARGLEADVVRRALPRMTLKALLRCAKALDAPLPPSLDAAATVESRPVATFAADLAGASDPALYPVSKPAHKLAGLAQTTGTANYVDDIPRRAGHLHAAFVHARQVGVLQRVDVGPALAVAGVRRVVTAADLDTHGMRNWLGKGPAPDERLLVPVEGKVRHVGAPLAIVVGTTRDTAERAARLVGQSFADAPCGSADDFFPAEATDDSVIESGDVDGAMATAAFIVEGEAACGRQFHAYMETQTTTAIPDAGGVAGRAGPRLRLECASQGPGAVADHVAAVLRVPASTIACSTARTGGAYGGKANRCVPVAAAAAVAATVVGAPVTIALALTDNMRSLGGRRPYRFAFRAGATADGRIVAITGDLVKDQGASSDLGGGLDGARELKLAIDGPYFLPNVRVRVKVARTNTPANTWCRAPTFLPGHFMAEAVLERVAAALGKAPSAVREVNIYHEGQRTPGGLVLKDCTLRRCVNEALDRAEHAKLVEEVRAFNAASRHVKRGVSYSPFKYPMPGAVGRRAMVTVAHDGSVLVEQSGTEVGQGLLIKAVAAAAKVLGCDEELIVVGDTTSALSNMVTGGSTTSEANVASVTVACEQIRRRMDDVAATIDSAERPGWTDLVRECYQRGVDLAAFGAWDGTPMPGALPRAELYHAYGCGVAAVQVDALACDARVLRLELVTDQGRRGTAGPPASPFSCRALRRHLAQPCHRPGSGGRRGVHVHWLHALGAAAV